MALPNEIQVGRYNRFVQKLLSIKGHATTFLASPEVDFMLPLFHGTENRYLEGWDLFGLRGTNPAPGAGNFATLTLRNPVGSNVIVAVTRIAGQEGTSGSTELLTLFRPGTAGANAGDENTVLGTQGWDGRGRSASTLVVSTNTAAQVVRAGGIQISEILVQPLGASGALGEHLLRGGDEIPLTPGSLLTHSAGTLNSGTSWIVWWRERFLEDSERA